MISHSRILYKNNTKIDYIFIRILILEVLRADEPDKLNAIEILASTTSIWAAIALQKMPEFSSFVTLLVSATSYADRRGYFGTR